MSAAVPVVVHFLGASLSGVLRDGVRYVALRPIVEGMGLNWSSQHAKVTADEVLGPTVVEIAMVAEDGKRRAMTCLPEEFLQGWMFTIKPGKVRADLREKIIRYKRECYRVLHQAFNAAEAAGPVVRLEYLDGYHGLHDVIATKAQKSKNQRFVHQNANKAINKIAGISAGSRDQLPVGTLSLVSTAQRVAQVAFACSCDHHDGHRNMVVALNSLSHLLSGSATPAIERVTHPPPRPRKGEAQPAPTGQASIETRSAPTEQAS